MFDGVKNKKCLFQSQQASATGRKAGKDQG